MRGSPHNGDERLLHYASERVEQLRPCNYIQRPDFKPNGLWLSADDDWRRWCEGENFHLGGLAYCHEVTLARDAKILRLRDARDIDRFTARYWAELPALPYLSIWIDWRKVAQKYQGIIIAPYCWSRRLEEKTRWYYGWDCASGCVWDLAAIESIMEIGVTLK